jgi:hypothetical protein
VGLGRKRDDGDDKCADIPLFRGGLPSLEMVAEIGQFSTKMRGYPQI